VWLVEMPFDWAKEQKIILFVLPAHTSHILQPLDVACFGPFQKIYNVKMLMSTGPASISRYDVCKLATTKNSFCLRFTSCDTLRVKLSSCNNTRRCVVGRNALFVDIEN
jgi:hypothetical protein